MSIVPRELTREACYGNAVEPCTNPRHVGLPAAVDRLRGLIVDCERGDTGDGVMETPLEQARQLGADLRVVLGALGVEVEQ